MTYDPSGKLSARHSLSVAETDDRHDLGISPQTGDYLIGDHSATGYNTLRLLAIGSRYAVDNCRHRLHLLGYAEPREWSQILPLKNPDGVLRGLTPTDVMRILTKRVTLPQQ